MKTIQKFLLISPCALAILVACGKNPTPDPTPDPIPDPTLAARAFEATFDAGSNTAYGQQNKVVIAECSVTFGTATFTDTTDTTTNTRYLKAVFPVTNNSTSAMTNLTLNAFNRSSTNIGGTGMRTLTNFVGTTSSSDAAQAIKPTHGMTDSSTVTSGQEDFQAFQPTELSSIKSTAITNGAMTNSDTVLEYGYVARYCIANCSDIQRLKVQVGSGLVEARTISFVAKTMVRREIFLSSLATGMMITGCGDSSALDLMPQSY